MATKLTLSIDAAVIRQAKAFAKHRCKSLSRLVEEYLRFVSADPEEAPPISSRVLAVADSLEMPPGVSYDMISPPPASSRRLAITLPYSFWVITCAAYSVWRCGT